MFQRDITSIEVVLDDQDSGKNRSGLLVVDVPSAIFNEFGDVTGIESITSFQHSVTLVLVDLQPGREGRRGVDDIEYLLVVAAESSGGHRLIVKSDRRIKHVFPMSD